MGLIKRPLYSYRYVCPFICNKGGQAKLSKDFGIGLARSTKMGNRWNSWKGLRGGFYCKVAWTY
jgi:hypothetical protein